MSSHRLTWKVCGSMPEIRDRKQTEGTQAELLGAYNVEIHTQHIFLGST